MPAKSKKKEKGELLRFKIILFLLPLLVRAYFKLLDMTCRVVFLNREHEEAVCWKRSFACASFHGVMLFPLYYCRRYRGVAMVSRSWDGELIHRSLRQLNYQTTRGSSSRGGKEGLEEMIQMVKEKDCSAGQAVDGPRGPARVAKMGIVVVARETGLPIVPLVSWATRFIQFKSWDKMILPLPFGTIVMAFGKPTIVPRGLEREDYERIRQGLEDEMHRICVEAEQEAGEIKRGRLYRFPRK